jgi:hypothetical protein
MIFSHVKGPQGPHARMHVVVLKETHHVDAPTASGDAP